MKLRITLMALLVSLVLGVPSRGQPPTENPGPDMIKRWADLMSLRRAKPTLPENPDPDMMKRVLDQARLQGEWLPKHLLTTNGIEPYPLKGRALDFTDTSFTQTEGRRRVQAGTFSLDPSSRTLELVVDQHDAWDVGATPQKPNVPLPLRCGYQVYGDLLTVCYTASKDRPADLTPGVGRTVVVYERVRQVLLVRPATSPAPGAAPPPPQSRRGQVNWVVELNRSAVVSAGISSFILAAFLVSINPSIIVVAFLSWLRVGWRVCPILPRESAP